MGSTDLKKSSWAFREAPIRVPETLRVRQRFSKSSGDFKKSSGDFLRNQIQPAESLLIICTAGSKVGGVTNEPPRSSTLKIETGAKNKMPTLLAGGQENSFAPQMIFLGEGGQIIYECW